MDRARPGGEGTSAAGSSTGQEVPASLHALFQRRVAGDDALLKLAGLRFAQMGVAAEVYADTPGELDHLLRFVPPHPSLPVVHLNRTTNLLHEQSRALVAEFADRFAGRVAGLVVHDKREMEAQTDRLLTVMRELNARLDERPGGPVVFLEYAAGLEPGWFVEVAERLQDAERVSCCIDVGHIGIRQATARFAHRHPGLSLRDLSPGDGRLPDLVADVQDAVQRRGEGPARRHPVDRPARQARPLPPARRASPRPRPRRSLQLPGAAPHSLQLPRPRITGHDVRARWPGCHRVRSHRGMPAAGSIVHAGDSPGRRPAAAR